MQAFKTDCLPPSHTDVESDVVRSPVEDSGVSVEVKQVGAEPDWVVRATATGPWSPGTHRGVIRTETDDARQPVIELP